MRFGALVAALARRPPWSWRKAAATLDRLSGGRLVVGVGLGAAPDMLPFGEGGRPAELAAQLDEDLEVLVSLWGEGTVNHEGERFHLHGAALRPTPLQRPRIPIWVAGFWPSQPLFRAPRAGMGRCRWRAVTCSRNSPPPSLGRCSDYIEAHRTLSDPFDLIAFAVTRPRSSEVVAEYDR